jgi:dihydrofolate synthase/folylpolyglutamate synthase
MSFLSELKIQAQSEWRGMELGLERITQACEKLGHPERQFPSIHIAGTNGKGSVAAMLHSILSHAGYKVGLFTSPHLVRLNERFRVGDEEITDEELEEILEELSRRGIFRFAQNDTSPLTPHPSPLTFFELCTLTAFLHFAKKKVDLAVIEVGLGGRLDATNVITPLVSVITEISLDHTEILGPDLESIAKEKAGIIKEGVPVVCGATDEKIKLVIQEIAEEKKAPVVFSLPPGGGGLGRGGTLIFNCGSFKDLQASLPGNHQIHNATIALMTLNILGKKIEEAAIRQGLKDVRWPGRLEWLSQNPPILLDGAHNPAGIRVVVEYLKRQEIKKWKVLFSAARDKAVGEMLQELQSIASEIIICRMESSRSVDPKNVGANLVFAQPPEKGDYKNRPYIRIGGTALETFQSMVKDLKPGEGLLVTGSLYLIGEIKKELMTRSV